MEVGRYRCRSCVSDHTGDQSISASGSRGVRDDIVRMAASVDLLGVVELPFAEQLDVVRVGCLRPSRLDEVLEASPAADLVAVERTGVAFDRLAQRDRLGLVRRASLARALAPQAAPQRAQRSASQREIASRPVHVQPRIRFVGGAREPCHHAADGTDQVAVPGEGCLRRHRPQSATVANALRARPKPHRSRRTTGQSLMRSVNDAVGRHAVQRVDLGGGTGRRLASSR